MSGCGGYTERKLNPTFTFFPGICLPMRLITPIVVWLGLLLAVRAGETTRVDFANDLIPVLTKHGCNSGACHGAAIGRGGFQLSLYGGNPEADFRSIARQLEGRRINLAVPEESLILLKPTEVLEHGGGYVFSDESESARPLVDWIRQGATNKSLRKLERLELKPHKVILRATGESTQLSAIAHYSDGTSRDVTHWTVLKAEDSSAVEIDPESAECRVMRRGRHLVVARFSERVVPIEFIVPLTDEKMDLTDEPRNNFIDDEILASLTSLGLPPSPLVDDATFQRRVTLDLVGYLPFYRQMNRMSSESWDEVFARFDGENKLNFGFESRAELIDELLESDEFSRYWALQLAKLLRVRRARDGGANVEVYHRWLEQQLSDRVSYKTIARSLMTANGDTREYGPTNFFKIGKGAREQAELMSEVFMGSRLRCANCHNHPLDRWTQDDYHGLAAIFAKVERGVFIKDKPKGQVIHPRTLEPATPRVPGDAAINAKPDLGREDLANWLTDDENPFFARAIVNRLWRHMMGRGLVEPVDDFRATNPATHPELLKRLADDFVAHDCSIRHTLGIIARSAAYARSSNALPENRDDRQFYSHAIRKPLEAEVLADAISDVLWEDEEYGDKRGVRAVSLVDPSTPSRTLDVLGRCDREMSCESSVATVGGLPQQLHLLNGPLLNARIASESGTLSFLLKEGVEPIKIIERLYFIALHRLPNSTERAHWTEQLAKSKNADERRAFLEDFVWGLMTCEEFKTNH